MKIKQMYEISFIYLGGRGGIDDYFAFFARDITPNSVVVSNNQFIYIAV